MIPSNRILRRRAVDLVFAGLLAVFAAATCLSRAAAAEATKAVAGNKQFVRVSPRDPRYFELSDGRPYVPVGFNANNWQNELLEGRPPEQLAGLTIDVARFQAPFDLGRASVQVYDPWQDRYAEVARTGSTIALPSFQRSLVIRVQAQGTRGEPKER